MTEQILALAVAYGLPFLALSVGLTCLGVPIPSSLLMLAAGSLAASGDFAMGGVFAAALLGAIAGDLAGYFVGRRVGARALGWMARTPQARTLVDKARGFVKKRGAWGVFLTRWLLSPLGPYVNLIAGAMDMPRLQFALMVVAGEVLWVGFYIALGATFSAAIMQIADIAANASALLAALVVLALLGRYLWRALQSYRAGDARRSTTGP